MLSKEPVNSASVGRSEVPAILQVGKQNRNVEVRSAGVHEDSPIVRIFGGQIRSSLRSKSSKADSVSIEPFNHLLLDISSPSVDSVWTALEAYCGDEAVNEDKATKRLQFNLLPKVLIVNLKRFSYNKGSGCPQKIKKAVKYEEKLTLDKSWLVDDVEPQEYQLTAVICHHGDSVNGGHYNAAVRYNNEWFMYDDALVRQMEVREVMNQQFTAYLLLYQCHDKVAIRP
jgi:ubiquitin carboxyl-terminal hydrolase 10